jgi:riboflavin kinase / FMN adenylyltransferase
VWVTFSLTTVQTPTIVALGNFDGVHQGHVKVIAPVSELTSVAANAMATVVTFSPHPQEFFTGQRRTLLTPIDEKIPLLQSIGIEQLVLLPFNRELANLSPEQFIETILVQCLQAERVSVGEDFRFGCQRSGSSVDLQAIAATFGIKAEIVPLQTHDGQRISSSAIRQALEQGQVEQANRLLGRRYQLIGQVVQGQQLGRTIGFPTANLKLPPEKFLPRKGVYAVWVHVQGQPMFDRSTEPILGVMNLGDRPTVNGTDQTIEVHLLDWSGDLYGHTLTVSLEKFLRPEQKFASLDALKDQIQADSEAARGLRAL